MDSLLDLVQEGRALIEMPLSEAAGGPTLHDFVMGGYRDFFKRVGATGKRWLAQRGYPKFSFAPTPAGTMQFEGETADGKRFAVEVTYTLSHGDFEAVGHVYSGRSTHESGHGTFKAAFPGGNLSTMAAVEGIHAALLRAGSDLRKKLG